MRMMPNKPKTFEFPKQHGGGFQPKTCGTPGLDKQQSGESGTNTRPGSSGNPKGFPPGEGPGPGNGPAASENTRPGSSGNPAGHAPGEGPGPGNGPAANRGCFNTTDSFNPSQETQSGASEASSGSFQELLKSMQAS